MAIKHKQFSTAAAPSDASKIGGPAWNDDHMHSLGDIFPVAQIIISAMDEAPWAAVETRGLPTTGVTVHSFGHIVTTTFDTSSVQAPDGFALEWFLAGENYRLYDSAFYRLLPQVHYGPGSGYDPGELAVYISFSDADGDPAKMQHDSVYSATLFAEVVAEAVVE